MDENKWKRRMYIIYLTRWDLVQFYHTKLNGYSYCVVQVAGMSRAFPLHSWFKQVIKN